MWVICTLKRSSRDSTLNLTISAHSLIQYTFNTKKWTLSTTKNDKKKINAFLSVNWLPDRHEVFKKSTPKSFTFCMCHQTLSIFDLCNKMCMSNDWTWVSEQSRSLYSVRSISMTEIVFLIWVTVSLLPPFRSMQVAHLLIWQ